MWYAKNILIQAQAYFSNKHILYDTLVSSVIIAVFVSSNSNLVALESGGTPMPKHPSFQLAVWMTSRLLIIRPPKKLRLVCQKHLRAKDSVSTCNSRGSALLLRQLCKIAYSTNIILRVHLSQHSTIVPIFFATSAASSNSTASERESSESRNASRLSFEYLILSPTLISSW